MGLSAILAKILCLNDDSRTTHLAISFLAITLFAISSDFEAMTVSWKIFVVLPGLTLLAYAAIWLWLNIVHYLNSKLKPNDVASFGPLFGCSLLSICICLTLSYLSTHFYDITPKIFVNTRFLGLCAAYLLAIETIRIPR